MEKQDIGLAFVSLVCRSSYVTNTQGTKTPSSSISDLCINLAPFLFSTGGPKLGPDYRVRTETAYTRVECLLSEARGSVCVLNYLLQMLALEKIVVKVQCGRMLWFKMSFNVYAISLC